jgi:thymidylate synthase (FAD)
VALVRSTCFAAYDAALALGVAKEVARVLLPEGLVPTKLYVNGSVRSWWHYLLVRLEKGTQKEHREIAQQCFEILKQEYTLIGQLLTEELERQGIRSEELS